MPSFDSQQVTLRLTKKPFILKELARKRRLSFNSKTQKNDSFRIQFDSHTFEFRDDNEITVGKSAAECMIQDSHVILGPSALDGEVAYALEIVREFDLALGEHENPNTCTYCKSKRAFESARELAEHIIEEHSEPVDDEEKESAAHAGAE